MAVSAGLLGERDKRLTNIFRWSLLSQDWPMVSVLSGRGANRAIEIFGNR
jgi:hypothetical protein